MSGGMGRPWSHGTSGPAGPFRRAPAEPPPAEQVRPGSGRCPVHHCWVDGVVDEAAGYAGRYPGLLLEWRREQDDWAGLVAYVLPEPTGTRVRLVQRWLPASCLRPVDDGST